MANTTNLDLVKPLGTDHALISVINSNMDKIDAYAGKTDDAIGGLADGLAIVTNGNTHAAITSGQFVYVRGHGTLADGLYQATANIAEDGTLSGSNLTADSSGGLNALNDKIDGFLARTSIANFSANNDTWTATSNGFVNVIASENATGTWYAYAYEGSTIRAGGIGGLNGTGGLTESFMFPVHKGVTYKLLVGGISSVITQFYPM